MRPHQISAGVGSLLFGEQLVGQVFADEQIGPSTRRWTIVNGLAELHDDVAKAPLAVVDCRGELQSV
ncbi:hypothetical protein BJI69_10485 [Luteibacter rhizovicinus DSM 16549]|uniref:Uncharacterized protein n=1 Tax=Luteibacter rhizovicinus DSM 16549 TaxID=1440763 RepID=A0A1L3ETC3_9GAMM|nr:hypothetical protein BJI69_10485 [Luteibacter rhizovicinus DSM 16549]